MSKNNKSAKSSRNVSAIVATVEAPMPSANVLPIVAKTPETVRAEIAKLQADLVAAENAVKEAEKQAILAMDAKISELPAHLGLQPTEGQNALSMVLALIVAMIKNGTTAPIQKGKKSTGGNLVGKGGRLSDEQKGDIAKGLQNGEKSDVIASRVGCSIPTVNAIKSKLGLTRAHKKSAEAVTA